MIRDCRLGYRTFGRLDSTRSNAVLVVPWFQGTSGELARHIGPGQLVDSERFFVVAVDALGNGISSSPSNGRRLPGEAFPSLTIPDQVESQYRLLTKVLGITHLAAVVGISMGGMQAVAWATRHPDVMDTVVSIAGSPRSTEADRRQWEAAVESVRSRSAGMRAALALGRLEPLDALWHLRVQPDDFVAQAESIQMLDLTTPFGGSMERTAAAIKARTLVVVSARDEIVDPAPARALAAAAGAELLVLDGRCGHLATRCERDLLFSQVRHFLESGRHGQR